MEHGKDLKLILQEPTEDPLLSNQIENKIGFLTYIAKNHTSIPVPRVYAYDVDSQSSTPFIPMEYIRGEPLSTAWKSYTQAQKLDIASSLATMIVDMAEIRFDCIRGLRSSHAPGPRVEGPKLFKGRDKF